MKQTIEAKEQELVHIFSDSYLFEIPGYQRPYAWTTEQTSNLLSDLLTAMEQTSDNVIPYFLGSIVLIKDPKNARAEVVDGQQRLITLTILFAVLRELSKDDQGQKGLETFICEEGNIFTETEDRFRLSLRERDRQFFCENIQKRGNLEEFLKQNPDGFSDSQKRIFENTSYLKSELSKIDQSKRVELTKFLAKHSYLVVVSASDKNSAYRIFWVMNDRGLNLLPTDIFKAEIIGDVPGNIREKYTNAWEEIEEELGREEFRNLFVHIRMIYMKKKQQETLNQEFRDNVLNQINGEEFIEKVLKPLAKSYKIVSRSPYESTTYGESVNKYLDHLNRLDNYDWIPPAIVFFHLYRADEKALVKFVRDLERLSYALFILRANVNKRIKRYASLLHAIETKEDLYADSSPLQLTPEDKDTVIKNLDVPIDQKPVRMPLLLRIDSALTDKGVTYKRGVITIEHVLPQTPDPASQWVKWFPDEDNRKQWTDRLGNLVLLSQSKNAQAQNFEFDRKKKEYFQRGPVTTFALTSEVLNETEWTQEVLERRQKRLLDKLKEEWRLN